ncbi:XRE family transcriptional regulator [Shewanella sp. S23-S33]|uniref:XRE family transcriptional regulator n=1 Tax=Shewanella sp. S23-S33 TaxID=3342769 RepID=UPI00372D67F9
MKNIGHRIKVKRKLIGLTQEELGRSVGVSKVAVSRWESDKNAINHELLKKVASALQVDAEWLLTGELFATKNDENASVYWAPNYNKYRGYNVNDFTHHGDTPELTPIPSIYIKNIKNLEKIFTFNVCGDSMEPVIYDGSIVGVDAGDTSIKDGKMYLLKQNDLHRVKIIQLLPDEIVLKNYNVNYKDEIYKVKNSNIQILGKVFWYSVGVKS